MTNKQGEEERQVQTDKIQIAVMNTKMDYLKEGVDGVNKKMDIMAGQFVGQAEFKPVRNIVYGLVGLVLTAVILAIMALVVRK